MWLISLISLISLIGDACLLFGVCSIMCMLIGAGCIGVIAVPHLFQTILQLLHHIHHHAAHSQEGSRDSPCYASIISTCHAPNCVPSELCHVRPF
jgi:hypothetical protein